jgi:hypothetical protein
MGVSMPAGLKIIAAKRIHSSATEELPISIGQPTMVRVRIGNAHMLRGNPEPRTPRLAGPRVIAFNNGAPMAKKARQVPQIAISCDHGLN